MEKLTILVIENEGFVAQEIVQRLQRFGYRNLYYATSIKSAKELLKQYPINLLIMDINLKGEDDGVRFYQELISPPLVIYFTAYKDDTTIERLIKTSPIGYLTKPYRNEELKAMLLLAKSHLSKPVSTQNEKFIELGEGYMFDSVKKRLLCTNKPIHLGKKELQLLMLLISARGTTVSYYTIEQEIWGSQPVSSSTLRTLIYRLRSKLHKNLIQSEANIGIFLVKIGLKNGNKKC